MGHLGGNEGIIRRALLGVGCSLNVVIYYGVCAVSGIVWNNVDKMCGGFAIFLDKAICSSKEHHHLSDCKKRSKVMIAGGKDNKKESLLHDGKWFGCMDAVC